MEETKTLKETAQNYEAPTTRNVAELEVVRVDSKVEEREGEAEGKKFSYNVINVNGFDYRVPNSVLNNLQAILKENPNLQTFKVKRSGEGMKTTYTVIPLS